MTKFEDQLLGQLMTEHGHELRALERPAPEPAPARRRARRPVWLATGAAGTVAAATAGVMALGSAPAMAAYSVTRHDGTLSVSVYNATGVAGANAALKKIKARVVVVPVGESCPGIELIPVADPPPHLATWVSTSVNSDGHRSV
ncbi:MAG TPA: hypothetical protein VGQ05_07270, partial [Streptosporangiaceae bacterium]|nr:hypothetical protein [Streptosporangiaceae bacterium]